MLNKYPLWKYLLVLFVILLGVFYAAPNLYTPDPALQIAGQSSAQIIDDRIVDTALKALDEAGIEHFGETIEAQGRNALVRLRDSEQQLQAQARVSRALGDGFIVALNLAPTTPDWLSDYGAQPMKLGLDLSGGVHFKLDVDAAAERRMENYFNGIKRALREERIRGFVTMNEQGKLESRFRTEQLREQARGVIADAYPELVLDRVDDGDSWNLLAAMTEQTRKEIADYAVSQNLTTLRNRVNELGVSEPLVQRQGRNRIVVELPGVQDTATAKRDLGATANLEFRLEALPDAPVRETQQFQFRANERIAQLKRDIITTGNSVSDARSSFDENGMPQVSINLDASGGRRMADVTKTSVGRRMAVIFIESRTRTELDRQTGEQKQIRYKEQGIISLATIQAVLGNQFRITGLDNSREASELALLLRAGALAAPIYFVEERTIGPSLGAENIERGLNSVIIGFVLVMAFMIAFYRWFGVIANVALAVNLVLLIAIMSLFQAVLTLPGIAGIVLTVGMAVDANVLIFSRIREERMRGLADPQAIRVGFERAFVTILDSNITTLLVAIILAGIGSGPVKGFAITLAIGICTSLYTATLVTRLFVEGLFGHRHLPKWAL